MASLTFGSFGDLISICGILIKASKALSDSKGSAADYHGLVKELEALVHLLESLKSFETRYPQLRHNSRLREVLNLCALHLNRYTEDIKPYRALLIVQLPAASSFKQIYRKLRWLSQKEKVASFRSSLVAYNTSISGILALSGIDLTQDCHRLTLERLDQLVTNLREQDVRSDSVLATASSSILTTIDTSEQSSILRNRTSNQIAYNNHVDLCARLEQLRLAIVVQKPAAKDVQHPLLIRQSFLEINKLYIRLIVELLRELNTRGWIRIYQFLQLMRCFMLQESIPATPQGKCLLFQDAILRSFYVDVDFVSYNNFIRMIEDHFRDTIGWIPIKMKSYYFEQQNRRVDLASLWSQRGFHKKALCMRVDLGGLTSFFRPASKCPSCGRDNGHQFEDPSPFHKVNEIQCTCGLYYTVVDGKKPYYALKGQFSSEHPQYTAMVTIEDFDVTIFELMLVHFKRIQRRVSPIVVHAPTRDRALVQMLYQELVKRADPDHLVYKEPGYKFGLYRRKYCEPYVKYPSPFGIFENLPPELAPAHQEEYAESLLPAIQSNLETISPHRWPWNEW